MLARMDQDYCLSDAIFTLSILAAYGHNRGATDLQTYLVL